MVKLLEITEEERNLTTSQYCIDTQSMMKALGIISASQSSSKDCRALERCKLIPKSLELAAPPSEGAAPTDRVSTNVEFQAPPSWGASSKDRNFTNVVLATLPSGGAANTDRNFTNVELVAPPSGGAANTDRVSTNVEFQAPPLGGALSKDIILYTNHNCMIVQTAVVKNGQTYHPIKYMITRNACYKTLARSFNEDKFADYFSLKWQISEQYKKYSSDYDNHITLTDKNRVIGSLESKVDELTNMTRNLTVINTKQSDDIQQLLAYGKDANEKLDALFDFMVEFARMTVPMWVGSSVFKTQFQSLLNQKTTAYALKHLKVMFIVGFHGTCEEPFTDQTVDGNEIDVVGKLQMYFCCTNFGDVGIRIKQLYNRHDNNMYMMKPEAICLISGEINMEKTTIEHMNIFPDNVSVVYSNKHKAFHIGTVSDADDTMIDTYTQIVTNARSSRFQGYQMRMDTLRANDDLQINDTILNHLAIADGKFFESVLPFCQEYINCYSTSNDDNIVDYRYSTPSRKTTLRVEFDNAKYTDGMYALMKINRVLDSDGGTLEVDRMVTGGLITKKDIKALKKVAEVEKVDISHVKFPDESSDEE